MNYTLDKTRSRIKVKKLTSGPTNFAIVESNGKGNLIIIDTEGTYWMSMPRRNGRIILYPMKIVI